MSRIIKMLVGFSCVAAVVLFVLAICLNHAGLIVGAGIGLAIAFVAAMICLWFMYDYKYELAAAIIAVGSLLYSSEIARRMIEVVKALVDGYISGIFN